MTGLKLRSSKGTCPGRALCARLHASAAAAEPSVVALPVRGCTAVYWSAKVPSIKSPLYRYQRRKHSQAPRRHNDVHPEMPASYEGIPVPQGTSNCKAFQHARHRMNKRLVLLEFYLSPRATPTRGSPAADRKFEHVFMPVIPSRTCYGAVPAPLSETLEQ